MSAIGSTPLVSPSTTSSGGTNTLQNPNSQLNVNDFINMMVTQLQNQDPLSPESDSDLMSQMSQIGQLQTSTQLQSTLTTLGLQTSLASAGNLIGKTVQGLDSTGAPQSGVVDSVKVANNAVSLELDTGAELSMSNVTSITATPTAAGPAATSATPASTATAPLGN
jgi:flagellar basal-body rod modification protein FlgD